MKVDKTVSGNRLDLAVTGRIDTTTAPQLEEEIRDSLDGIEELVMDFSGVEYISSAGLRVLLAAQKIMNKQGTMKVTKANDDIMEIFDVTGFSDILSIE